MFAKHQQEKQRSSIKVDVTKKPFGSNCGIMLLTENELQLTPTHAEKIISHPVVTMHFLQKVPIKKEQKNSPNQSAAISALHKEG